MDDKSIMPFGQYRGRQMQHVPADYLDWLRDQHWLEKKHPGVAAYIEENKDIIKQELKDEGRI